MKSPKILDSINLNSVMHLQANANYTQLYITNGKAILSAYSLKVFNDLLPTQHFIRIDRSNLVHHKFIKSCKLQNYKTIVTLKNKQKLKVPRRKQMAVLNQWQEVKTQTLGL